jgi:hypothetical protein
MSAPRLIIDQVIELIGQPAYDDLCVKLGGKRIIVPHKIGDNHPLREAGGPDLAQIIAKEFAGCELQFPVRAKKRAAIKADIAAGLSNGAIAKKYWCTIRFVQMLRADPSGKTDQLHLF